VHHRLYCPNSTTNFFSVSIAVTVTVVPSTPQRKSQPCRETINSGLLGCVPRSRWYVRIRTRRQAANAVAGGAAPPPCMARSSRAARVEISASIHAPEGIRRGRHRQRQRHRAGKNRDGAILCSTRRGESRRTAAPLTLTLTPLYAPDPDASVRGAAHPGTGNATKLICQSITFGSLLPLPCPPLERTMHRTATRVTPGAGPGSGLSPSASPTTGNTLPSSGTRLWAYLFPWSDASQCSAVSRIVILMVFYDYRFLVQSPSVL
jgi:hypothetical protein